WTVSWPVLLNLSLTVAFFKVGGVILGKFTTSASSTSLMHLIASEGSGFATMSSHVLLVRLLLPWTVTKVMTMTVPPAGIVGVKVKTACPTLLMPTDAAGVAGPVLCRTNPRRERTGFMRGGLLCAPKGCAGQTSASFVPVPSGQSSPASASPVLKTRGDGRFWPFRLLMRSPLKPTKAGVSGTSTLNWVVKVLVPPNRVKTTK